jgi:hypothetical protein
MPTAAARKTDLIGDAAGTNQVSRPRQNRCCTEPDKIMQSGTPSSAELSHADNADAGYAPPSARCGQQRAFQYVWRHPRL